VSPARKASKKAATKTQAKKSTARKKAVAKKSTGKTTKANVGTKKPVAKKSTTRKSTTRKSAAKTTTKKTKAKVATTKARSERRARTKGAGPEGAALSANGVRAILAGVPDADLRELYRFWSGERGTRSAADQEDVRRKVAQQMEDPEVIETRVAGLGRRLATILDLHLEAPRYERSLEDLEQASALAYLSKYDLEASLTVLERRALLISGESRKAQCYGKRCTSIPVELGDAILRQRRARRRGIFDAFTLRGHLDRMYDDPARASRTPPHRLREMYKMYANETAAVARIERLPEEMRGLVEKTVLEFGGILPRALFERIDTELSWKGRGWGQKLEESLVGTVERLELGRYGIHHNDETLMVFNEVALAWLRRVAVPGDPDDPYEEESFGVDLASNISRFIGFIIDHDVRFTQRGEIFKTTEKRILTELIPNPGREMARSEVLAFIYGFARHAKLIESTGERTFRLTAAGRDWEPLELDAKLKKLLEYAGEERGLGGEHYHQTRMRRILMRLLKRVEPGVWYDLMYVPFLARNTYLCSLDELAVEDYFAARSQAGEYTPMEDVQRLAWNLVSWVRQRLFLLGIVDLGYDSAERPVAVRLTRTGARLLGVSDDSAEGGPLVGNLIVTPDFQVVLFPTGDDDELIHDLDRFCEREKHASLIQFRISEHSVHRALTEGMFLKRILSTLEKHSRTPVPQNVVYSVRDWAGHAGLLHLSQAHVVRSENPDILKRFQQDVGVKAYVREGIDEQHVQMKTSIALRRMQSLLRDLGHLVELDE
jgi:hypothetical protein